MMIKPSYEYTQYHATAHQKYPNISKNIISFSKYSTLFISLLFPSIVFWHWHDHDHSVPASRKLGHNAVVDSQEAVHLGAAWLRESQDASRSQQSMGSVSPMAQWLTTKMAAKQVKHCVKMCKGNFPLQYLTKWMVSIIYGLCLSHSLTYIGNFLKA